MKKLLSGIFALLLAAAPLVTSAATNNYNVGDKTNITDGTFNDSTLTGTTTVPALSASALVMTNGTRGLASYAGTSCTNQALYSLSSAGAAACTSAFVGGSHTAMTALGLRSTGTGAFDLTLANTEDLTAARSLTFKVNNVSRTIDLGGNLTLSGALTTTGANTVMLVTTGTTGLTLPTAGTLATLAGSEALTNKTYNGNTWTAGTGTLSIGAGKTFTNSNTLTLNATDGSTVNFGAGGTVVYSSPGTIALTQLAAEAANTVVANGTGGSASPTALSVPSCSTSASALQWTSGTGFACNTTIAASTATSATNATNAANVATLQTTTNSTFFPLMVNSAPNSNQPILLSTSWQFNPATNTMTANLAGNATTATTATNIAGGTNGALPYQSGAGATALLAATVTANKVLMSGSSSAPSWSTPTFPNASATSGKFIKSDGTNWTASTGSASGVGACAANTWASTLNSDAAPTCTQPAAANLSDGTTGSGAVVLATSPTLTTAVAAGTWTASGTWTLPSLTLGGTVSGGSQAMNSLGAVRIGTAAALGTSDVLSVSTTGMVNTAYLKGDTAAASVMNVWNSATSGDNVLATYGTEGTFTSRGTIDYNRAGNAIRYNTTSDARLKTNIVDAPDQGTRLDGIKIRAYDWIETGTHVEAGVVAQELVSVAPEAVKTCGPNEPMQHVSAAEPGCVWAVDYSKLVPILVAEVQALRKRVAALEASRVAAAATPVPELKPVAANDTLYAIRRQSLNGR